MLRRKLSVGRPPGRERFHGDKARRRWESRFNSIDENLDGVRRRAMNRHLARCPHCPAVTDGTRHLIRLYRDERVFVLPDGFHERLKQKLRKNTAPRVAPQLWNPYLRPVRFVLPSWSRFKLRVGRLWRRDLRGALKHDHPKVAEVSCGRYGATAALQRNFR
jgi:anti-sigma factor RsiW